MSKLPYVVFFFTLFVIVGFTLSHYQATPIVSPQVALARQQIQQAAAEPEILPQVAPVAIAPAERMKLRTNAPIAAVPTDTLKQALAAQKASNKTLVHAANVLASAPAAQPNAAEPIANIKLYVQIGLTLIFIPLCLFFILSEKFNITQKNFAYTTIGIILGFWFTTGA